MGAVAARAGGPLVTAIRVEWWLDKPSALAATFTEAAKGADRAFRAVVPGPKKKA
jgi:hypothetical protein